MHPPCQPVDIILWQAPATTLIRTTGIREPIAYNPCSGGQGGLNDIIDVQRPRRENDQQFGNIRHCLIAVFGNHVAQPFCHWRPARFACC
jgi:hypothetical protein